jgi:hypothetical protein
LPYFCPEAAYSPTDFMQTTLYKYSIAGAAVVIAFYLGIYSYNKAEFLSPWVQWSPMVVYLVCMYLASGADCARFGVERDFREMVRAPFIVFLLINLGYWLFYYGLHLYDSSLTVMELDGQIQMLQQQIQAGTGDPTTANDMRQQLVELEKMKQHPVTPLGPILFRMALGSLGGFALAAGITGFRKMS